MPTMPQGGATRWAAASKTSYAYEPYGAVTASGKPAAMRSSTPGVRTMAPRSTTGRAITTRASGGSLLRIRGAISNFGMTDCIQRPANCCRVHQVAGAAAYPH